jgi:hypothetical protein
VHWNSKDPEKGPVLEVVAGVYEDYPHCYLTYRMMMRSEEKTQALAAGLLRQTRAVLDIHFRAIYPEVTRFEPSGKHFGCIQFRFKEREEKELFDRSIASLLFPSGVFKRVDRESSSLFMAKRGGSQEKQMAFIRGVLMCVDSKIADGRVERMLYENGDQRFWFSWRPPREPKAVGLISPYASQFTQPLFVINDKGLYRRWFDCCGREWYKGTSPGDSSFIWEFIGKPADNVKRLYIKWESS